MARNLEDHQTSREIFPNTSRGKPDKHSLQRRDTEAMTGDLPAKGDTIETSHSLLETQDVEARFTETHGAEESLADLPKLTVEGGSQQSSVSIVETKAAEKSPNDVPETADVPSDGINSTVDGNDVLKSQMGGAMAGGVQSMGNGIGSMGSMMSNMGGATTNMGGVVTDFGKLWAELDQYFPG